MNTLEYVAGNQNCPLCYVCVYRV